MTAIFSDDRVYRYVLVRNTEHFEGLSALRGWGERGENEAIPLLRPPRKLATVAFVGLNPSTADEVTDDPTVRRCVGFATRWGYERMVMLNVFAFRATDPKVMKAARNPIGPENDEHILRHAQLADLVVCCWGVHGLWHPLPGTITRQEDVYDLLREAGVTMHALGTTKAGAPKHPLYLSADLTPFVWTWPER